MKTVKNQHKNDKKRKRQKKEKLPLKPMAMAQQVTGLKMNLIKRKS